MSLREGVLAAPNLAELNILERALNAVLNERRDQIIQYYIDNDLEISFIIETRIRKRKVKVVGRAKPKWLGREYMTCIGTSPKQIVGKKLRVPKAWATDLHSEAMETGPRDDDDEDLPASNPETAAAMEGVEWDA